ncbi:Calx-beta domain-containing protein [Candidatus Albibeggiatoa sp. nov. NOAA]|uniref:Calx-beta domain-containing protein n=1 Tax=Candidatus Albibeggiatoa sp. nov. NOAA TaxID=3162724 RepID=UPI0032FBFC6F|nr:hypothetical protein [Thiotrichaceae bacterium]
MFNLIFQYCHIKAYCRWLLVLFSLLSLQTASAQWQEGFGYPGFNGDIFTILHHGEDIYVGGDFTHHNGVALNYIAKWNGSSWESLGEGFSGNKLNPDKGVYALAIDNEGNIIAGGKFANSGNQELNRSGIAKWNGSSWESLGEGFSNVYALTLDSEGSLIAGGRFFDTENGGKTLKGIMKWNGSNWEFLGDGLNDEVYALTLDSDENIIAGGKFTSSGDNQPVSRIAKWNGTSWESFGDGFNNDVLALSIDNDGNIFAGGKFTSSGNQAITYAAKWNGTSWESTSNDEFDDVIFALTTDTEGNTIAGGAFTRSDNKVVHKIAKLRTNSWERIASLAQGFNHDVNALAVDNEGNIIAGGYFTSVGSQIVNHIAKWNGTSWESLGDGFDGFPSNIFIDNENNIIVSGNFTKSGNQLLNGFAKWNGASWESFGDGLDLQIGTLALDNENNLIAGSNALGGNLIKWNGADWEPLDNGFSHYPPNLNSDEFNITGISRLRVDSENNIIIVALYTSLGDQLNYVAKWNGENWAFLGGGFKSRIKALEVDKENNIIVGGLFSSTSSGKKFNYIAKWNGTSWESLGNGFNTRVDDLKVDNEGNIIAGGYFTSSGNTKLRYLAKWTGTNWESIGGGVNSAVKALSLDNEGNIIVGGKFNSAGRIISTRFAIWNPPTINFALSEQSITEDKGSITLTVELSEASEYPISIPLSTNTSSSVSNNDYAMGTSVLTIKAGKTEAQSIITIRNDAISESDEELIIDMGSSINAIKGATSQFTLTIVDDDVNSPDDSSSSNTNSPITTKPSHHLLSVGGTKAHIISQPSGIDCKYGSGTCSYLFDQGETVQLILESINMAEGTTKDDYTVTWIGDCDNSTHTLNMHDNYRCLVQVYGKQSTKKPTNTNSSSTDNANTSSTSNTTGQIEFLNFSGHSTLRGGAEDVILGFILEGNGTADVILHADILDKGVMPQLDLNEVTIDNQGIRGDLLKRHQHSENFTLDHNVSEGIYTIQMSSLGTRGRGMAGISLKNNQLNLTNLSVRGHLKDFLVLNFIVSGEGTQKAQVNTRILSGDVVSELHFINLSTQKSLANNAISEGAIIEVSAGAYAILLKVIEGEGIGMIEADLIQ